MRNEIISLLCWTAVFAYIIFKANKDLGRLSGKIYIFHVFLSWFLLIFHSTAFKMLGWAVGHPKSILEYFFLPIGPLPAWFNLSSWAGSLICSIAAVSLSFSLAKRKEKGRIWLLRSIPVFYLFGVTEALKGFYKNNSLIPPLPAAISMNAVLLAIPFGAMYLFYRRENIKNNIFGKKTDKSS